MRSLPSPIVITLLAKMYVTGDKSTHSMVNCPCGPPPGSSFTVNLRDPEEGIQQQHATIHVRRTTVTHMHTHTPAPSGVLRRQGMRPTKTAHARLHFSGCSRKCDWTSSVSQNTQMYRRPCYPSPRSCFWGAVFAVGNVAGVQKDDTEAESTAPGYAEVETRNHSWSKITHLCPKGTEHWQQLQPFLPFPQGGSIEKR